MIYEKAREMVAIRILQSAFDQLKNYDEAVVAWKPLSDESKAYWLGKADFILSFEGEHEGRHYCIGILDLDEKLPVDRQEALDGNFYKVVNKVV